MTADTPPSAAAGSHELHAQQALAACSHPRAHICTGGRHLQSTPDCTRSRTRSGTGRSWGGTHHAARRACCSDHRPSSPPVGANRASMTACVLSGTSQSAYTIECTYNSKRACVTLTRSICACSMCRSACCNASKHALQILMHAPVQQES